VHGSYYNIYILYEIKDELCIKERKKRKREKGVHVQNMFSVIILTTGK